jgi:hypothetical protein
MCPTGEATMLPLEGAVEQGLFSGEVYFRIFIRKNF